MENKIPSLVLPGEEAETPAVTEAPAAETAAAKQVGELRRDVAAAGVERGPPAAAAGGLAEQVPEDILESCAACSAAARGTACRESGTAAHCADGIILLAFLCVGEHRVCLGEILEHPLRVGVTLVLIRMVFPCQLAVGLFDVGV